MPERKGPLEKTIVARVLAQCRCMGFWAMKIHGNAYTTAGVPDILAIKGGRAFWLECKRPGEEPTKIQHHRMRELASAGCRVTVVTSAADARHFLELVA